ncbi:cysteine hydrolase family protein [Gimibacter soli]|uniref:Cysteine hydrolase family protein n=1 Tax=Gimibacter soli TaxID=3024400 RepID=A0AAE9XU79_9PROT|nr:cysteine hydrolase family protein [Gimibacter soli]WCL54590.1 cysteine hydrolase family protein [Gimibacter soli]
MMKALILIDVQKAIDHPKWGRRGNPHAEANMAQLLAAWRAKGWPVVHIRHDSIDPMSPYRPDQPLHAFKDEVKPLGGETVFGKNTNNAFVDTGLEALLKANGVSALVIAGVLTQHSVDTSARMAASLGFKATVVSDATAATDVTDMNGRVWTAEDVQALTLAHLAADYALVIKTDALLASF